jgi:hypothetical protein
MESIAEGKGGQWGAGRSGLSPSFVPWAPSKVSANPQKEEPTMRRKLLALAFALAAVLGAGLLAPSSEAASGCYQVECNTCCHLSHGGVVCTQRACA